MSVSLLSAAEQNAEKAESFSCFGGFKLLHIKREVSSLLGLIGSHGIFDEYTRHDISHINSMLDLVTLCIIPEETQRQLTPTDWLMIVMSIYFHDLGLLVTKKEYNRREESAFPAFKEKLLSDDSGRNYARRLASLPDDERERFLYQEFVRAHHAQRIKHWVLGDNSVELGLAVETVSAVDLLLKPLGE